MAHHIDYSVRVAAAVKAAADSAGYTTNHLATITHIPRMTLTRKLAGGAPFNVRELHAVATALDVTPAALCIAADHA